MSRAPQDGASAAAAVTAGVLPAGPRGAHTYRQILRSSAVIGGSTAFTVVVGMVRSKAMALLLGPAGVGLMSLYGAIVQLAQNVAGMGINASAVREIAAAVGSGESPRIARTAAVVRRTSLALGVGGGALLLVAAAPVADVTFGSTERAAPVALLSIAVAFGVVAGGQSALLQGLRRISDLAAIAMVGGAAGTALTIALVYALREDGVVPALVAAAAATLLVSWWYARRARIEAAPISAVEVGREAGALLKLGFAFMASGMLMTGAAYVVRLVIVRRLGFDAAGLYQSAWAIGGLYVGFVLDAMGTDFYPRLTAAIRDRDECNRLVNEQAHVSMLLAGPGVIATLVLAPAVLTVLYSGAFREAAPILRWICIGAALKVVTWPLGFIVVAEGRRAMFLGVEVAYAALYVGLATVLVQYAGLVGAGVAFFGSYVLHGVVLYPIVRRLTGFRWSGASLRTGALFVAAIAAVFCGFELLPRAIATVFGVAVLAAEVVYSARVLVRLVSPERLPAPIMRVLVLAGIAPRQESIR